jgi:hypothetical protein
MAIYPRHVVMIAAIVAGGLLFSEPAFSNSYFGQLPVGNSDSFFQIGATPILAVDISAAGTRDPTLCASCNSIYTDNYKVLLFSQSGTLLESVNATNYFYYNMNSDSHGIGAGPVSFNVPAGATTLEIQSQLFIAGLLGAGGLPLGFGDLSISSLGSIAAVTAITPIPTTLPLFLTGLAGFVLLAWRARRRGNRQIGSDAQFG